MGALMDLPFVAPFRFVATSTSAPAAAVAAATAAAAGATLTTAMADGRSQLGVFRSTLATATGFVVVHHDLDVNADAGFVSSETQESRQSNTTNFD